jgi:hypothetical protein
MIRGQEKEAGHGFFVFIEAIRCDLENDAQYLLISEEEEDILSPPS